MEEKRPVLSKETQEIAFLRWRKIRSCDNSPRICGQFHKPSMALRVSISYRRGWAHKFKVNIYFAEGTKTLRGKINFIYCLQKLSCAHFESKFPAERLMKWVIEYVFIFIHPLHWSFQANFLLRTNKENCEHEEVLRKSDFAISASLFSKRVNFDYRVFFIQPLAASYGSKNTFLVYKRPMEQNTALLLSVICVLNKNDTKSWWNFQRD